ncbi:early nodulin-like protein 2 [Medicago truncatula]|nr:early nodulin-like protein 2 [Medicago truncatula]
MIELKCVKKVRGGNGYYSEQLTMMRYGFVLIVSMLVLSTSLSSAYKFNVGGNHGWAVKSSRHYYNNWATRTRFRINDILFFKYNKGSDSVLVVNKHDYDSCNIKNPIHKMHDGDSIYKFDKVGLFHFISGNLVNCQNGQKLKVAVYSPRHHHHHSPSLSPTVAPVHSPSLSPSWNSPARSPTQPSARNAPSPSAAPTRSPTQSPAWNSPSPSAAPARSPTQPPAWNAPSSSVAPSRSPTQPPAWNAPSSSVAPTRSPTQPPAWNAPSPSAIVWTAPAHSPVQSPAWNAPSSSAAPTQSPRNAPSPNNESISNEDDDDDDSF